MNNPVAVIGGGAAGCLAAAFAAEAGSPVVLIEKNSRIGRKVLISGKGRCNVTNVQDTVQDLLDHVPVNGRFLYSAFSGFMPRDTMDLMESLGVPLKVERGNRVFPVSDKAMDIVDALDRNLNRHHVKRLTDRATGLVIEDGRVTGVKTEQHGTIACRSAVLCTGGLSYPRTGSTGDGYRMAQEAGHTVTKLTPSLVPLVTDDPCCKDMQGLSLRNVTLRLTDTASGKCLYEELGELLFTHFGVSGPLVLSASSMIRDMQPGRYRLAIDWKPGLTPEQLDARLLRDFEKNANKDFRNALCALLPATAIPVFVEKSGIPGDKKVHQITKQERQALLDCFKKFELTVTDFRPVEEAIVTSGGVSTKEINPKTMESKLVQGLYFAGELIDVDGYTGGFNLQIAFSTGALAGQNAGGTNDYV